MHKVQFFIFFFKFISIAKMPAEIFLMRGGYSLKISRPNCATPLGSTLGKQMPCLVLSGRFWLKIILYRYLQFIWILEMSNIYSAVQFTLIVLNIPKNIYTHKYYSVFNGVIFFLLIKTLKLLNYSEYIRLQQKIRKFPRQKSCA